MPTATRTQAIENLILANQVRSKRALLKKDIAAGAVDLRRILIDPPSYAENATVRTLLMEIPKVGKIKAARILSRTQLGTSKTVGSLTDRQKCELAP
jgi:transposase